MSEDPGYLGRVVIAIHDDILYSRRHDNDALRGNRFLRFNLGLLRFHLVRLHVAFRMQCPVAGILDLLGQHIVMFAHRVCIRFHGLGPLHGCAVQGFAGLVDARGDVSRLDRAQRQVQFSGDSDML